VGGGSIANTMAQAVVNTNRASQKLAFFYLETVLCVPAVKSWNVEYLVKRMNNAFREVQDQNLRV